MSTNEIHNINAEYSPLILNAPKLKFKKVTISPTPFSLNDSFSDEEDKEHNYSTEINNVNSINDEEVSLYFDDIKKNITSFTLTIQKAVIQ